MAYNWYIAFSVLLTILFIFIAIYLYRRKLDLSSEGPFDNSLYIDIGDHKIHYQHFPGGKTSLVFLHGIGASNFIWRHLPDRLKKYSLYMLDIPGFGYSSKNPNYSHGLDEQAKVIDQFISKLKIKNPILIGSSMGGAISLWMARKNPNKYPLIIGISPATSPRHTKNVKLKYFNLLSRGIGLLINKTSLRAIMTLVVNKKTSKTNDILEAYLKTFRSSPFSLICFAKAFDNLLCDKRLPSHLDGLKSEVLLLWGNKDRLTPVSFAYDLKSYLPLSDLEILDGGSHHLMEDEPDWTAKKISNFIDQRL